MMQCQNIAEQRDTLTGILNEKGLKKAFCSADKTALYVVWLQICLFEKNFSALREMEKIDAITDVAKCLIEFCGSNDICAWVGANTFIGMLQSRASRALLRVRYFCVNKRKPACAYSFVRYCDSIFSSLPPWIRVVWLFQAILRQKGRSRILQRSAVPSFRPKYLNC